MGRGVWHVAAELHELASMAAWLGLRTRGRGRPGDLPGTAKSPAGRGLQAVRSTSSPVPGSGVNIGVPDSAHLAAKASPPHGDGFQDRE
jgi:hypothetical protein